MENKEQPKGINITHQQIQDKVMQYYQQILQKTKESRKLMEDISMLRGKIEAMTDLLPENEKMKIVKDIKALQQNGKKFDPLTEPQKFGKR